MKALIDHGRFASLPGLQVLALLTFAWGGAWLWLGGGLLLVLTLLLDEAGGEYDGTVERAKPFVYDALLYSTVPLVGLLTAGLMLYTASPGTPATEAATALGIGASGPAWWIEAAAATFSAGLLGAWAAGSFAHELMHRPTRGEWFLAQLLLARCLYPAYAIEHVYGHHVRVGTREDISTAPRGLGFWAYLPHAFAATFASAFRIEADRLKRRGVPWHAVENRFLQGIAMMAAMVGVVIALAGPTGLIAYLVAAAIGVLIVEVASYVAHYGLVRAAGRPVAPRHSWNAPRFISSSTMVNVQRHSHHHRSAGTPYWGLTVVGDAPIYPFGLAVMAVIAMVPPLWRHVLQPLLDDWDRRLASPEELALLAQSNPTGQAR